MGPFQDRTVRRNAAAMLRYAVAAGDYLRKLDSVLVATVGGLPALLAFGSKSPTVRERFPGRWAKSLPSARLVMVEGGHHFPMNDDPDLVAEAMRNWWHKAVEVTPPIRSTNGGIR
jgi:pimeloyl-ACP methyl ester carboxylesterase